MNHRITLVLGLACATALEFLAKGPWSHAVWAPTLIMLFTDIQKVITGKSPPGPAGAMGCVDNTGPAGPPPTQASKKP